MAATAVKRARHWFWALTVTAVPAMGALDQGLRSAPGPATGILVLAGSLVLIASTVQAARIMAVLAAPSRLLVPPGRMARRDPAARRHHRLGARRLSRSHSP